MTKSYGCYLRPDLDRLSVVNLLATTLGLEPGQLMSLDQLRRDHDRHQGPAAFEHPLSRRPRRTLLIYQLERRAIGFRTELDLLLDPTEVPGAESELDIARSLARSLREDVLVDVPGGTPNPYLWLLVRPDDQLVLVHESQAHLDDEPPVLVIDEDSREPFDPASLIGGCE